MLIQVTTLAFGLLPFAFATREFVNHGTTSGWPSTWIDPNTKGYVENSTSAFYGKSQSLKFGQEYLGSSYEGRYHAEKIYSNGYKRDEEKYYGFAFRLHSEWEFDPQSYNLAQFGANFNDIKWNGESCDDFSPTTMIWLNQTKLFARTKHGQMIKGQKCPPDDQKWNCDLGPNCQVTESFQLKSETSSIGEIKAGVWYRLTFRVKWKSDDTGIFQAWLNGTQVADKSKLKTTLLDDHRDYEFRVGLYANSWHDEKKMVGSQPKRQLWIDEIGVGSTFADADPDDIKKSA
ncbi:uncharacterized protein CC84DRAFT_1227251 [Paraphaeosphaeria sporulosa]|uniref:Polysaccharide lyase family 20 protein n=1 Tax=Paraphaeosphaeria sporulosa TaxID=1460663 RepID=A0A177CYT9_9PLEO|nr:uncharacterized protein CC84DRAFT_1227251 [Paraphaeosphaeria sporulosa]OAG12673.1 hypothetical protein CC84DRAFT_1227251 [Paraphaeosphaeria sporulosa]